MNVEDEVIWYYRDNEGDPSVFSGYVITRDGLDQEISSVILLPQFRGVKDFKVMFSAGLIP